MKRRASEIYGLGIVLSLSFPLFRLDRQARVRADADAFHCGARAGTKTLYCNDTMTLVFCKIITIIIIIIVIVSCCFRGMPFASPVICERGGLRWFAARVASSRLNNRAANSTSSPPGRGCEKQQSPHARVFTRRPSRAIIIIIIIIITTRRRTKRRKSRGAELCYKYRKWRVACAPCRTGRTCVRDWRVSRAELQYRYV